MNKGLYIFTFIVAFVSGITGGILSGKFLVAEPEGLQKDMGMGKAIVASEIHLVDSDGRDRWVLALSKAGEPNVTFINRGGWAPMAMGVNKDGVPYFNMVLEPSAKGEPSFVLMDAEMNPRAVIALKKDGEPYLELTDKQGRKHPVLGTGESEKDLTGSAS